MDNVGATNAVWNSGNAFIISLTLALRVTTPRLFILYQTP